MSERTMTLLSTEIDTLGPEEIFDVVQHPESAKRIQRMGKLSLEE